MARAMRTHVNLVVVAGIIALAILLGILNNLRVADERKVKWFAAPADLTEQESERTATP